MLSEHGAGCVLALAFGGCRTGVVWCVVWCEVWCWLDVGVLELESGGCEVGMWCVRSAFVGVVCGRGCLSSGCRVRSFSAAVERPCRCVLFCNSC